jgi:hypothetical protein
MLYACIPKSDINLFYPKYMSPNHRTTTSTMLMDPRAYVRRRRSRAQEPGGGGGEAPDGLRRGNGSAAAAAAALAAVLALPVARNLLLLPALSAGPAHHRSDHPPSPYSPPLHRLDHDQVAAFRRDGMLVLRQVLPPDLMRKMEAGGDDLMEGRSRHCEMTRFTGPPIFHGYDRYCGRPHLVHDYFRDVVYRSPFAHVAAQLMGVDDGGGGVAVAAGGGSTDADVDVDVDTDAEAAEEGGGGRIIRQFGDTFLAGTRIPRRWHVSFGGREGSSSSSSRAGQGWQMARALLLLLPDLTHPYCWPSLPPCSLSFSLPRVRAVRLPCVPEGHARHDLVRRRDQLPRRPRGLDAAGDLAH